MEVLIIFFLPLEQDGITLVNQRCTHSTCKCLRDICIKMNYYLLLNFTI